MDEEKDIIEIVRRTVEVLHDDQNTNVETPAAPAAERNERRPHLENPVVRICAVALIVGFILLEKIIGF